MYKNLLAGRRRSALSLAVLVMLSTALAGCQTTGEQLNQDYGTCESFGARYGSPEHSQCMLVQQQRRDNESLKALEEARLATEISRSSQEMIDARRLQRGN
jgi:ABC-type uncharacterized transport system auxiliary subunit